MFYGYVYALADNNPVVVLCKDETEMQRSMCAMTFDSDDDFNAFWRSVSMIRPHESV